LRPGASHIRRSSSFHASPLGPSQMLCRSEYDIIATYFSADEKSWYFMQQNVVRSERLLRQQ
jgi:hypothetical protein